MTNLLLILLSFAYIAGGLLFTLLLELVVEVSPLKKVLYIIFWFPLVIYDLVIIRIIDSLNSGWYKAIDEIRGDVKNEKL